MSSPTVQVDLPLPFTCDSKDAFVANKDNKKAFIKLLSQTLRDRNISVLQAKGDADQLIAKTAIDLVVEFITQVVGEDADIFQL